MGTKVFAVFLFLILCRMIVSVIKLSVLIINKHDQSIILDEQIKHQNFYYSKIKYTQEQLREIKHDLVNMIAVGGEEYKASVLACCKQIREQINSFSDDQTGGDCGER